MTIIILSLLEIYLRFLSLQDYKRENLKTDVSRKPSKISEKRAFLTPDTQMYVRVRIRG